MLHRKNEKILKYGKKMREILHDTSHHLGVSKINF